jgi:hypothetical protein
LKKLSLLLSGCVLSVMTSCTDASSDPMHTESDDHPSDSDFWQDAEAPVEAFDAGRDVTSESPDARGPEVMDAGWDSSTFDGTQRDAEVNADSGSTTSMQSVDCTKETGFCIDAQGIRDRQAFACSARAPRGFPRDAWAMKTFAPGWLIVCHSPSADDLYVSLEIPTQTPGQLRYVAAPGGGTEGFEFSIQLGSLSQALILDRSAGNLEKSEFTGSLAADQTLSGTLIASWREPQAGCRTGDARSPCVAGALRLTLHVPLQP